MANGFFEPVDIFGIERTTAYKRIIKCKHLIIVDHHRNIVADALAYRVNRRDILLYCRVTQPELDRTKASGEQFLGFIRERSQVVFQSKPAAIVGGDIARRCPDEICKGLACSYSERVP